MATNNFDELLNNSSSTTATNEEIQKSDLKKADTQTTSRSTYSKVIRDTYTDEELKDVNAITVTIPDTKTPIVVFFGPQSSGKTLVLLRLIRFLQENGYRVIAEEVFRPKTDKHYAEMCTKLNDLAYSSYAPGGNDVISFMLVKVLDKVGKPICQILEAPGEHYFDGTASNIFPTYINAVRMASNRKIWVYFAEQDWGKDQNERNLYAQRIIGMQQSPKDRVVFLFNKADRQPTQFQPNGTPNTSAFFNVIDQQYPGIFTRFRNTGMARILFGEYNFKALCFSSGVFNRTSNGREVWTLGEDFYCQNLWRILKM
ncbi:MAG: hypothetical protein IAA73_01280 [Bacteroidetes bacterium]|uniref:Uncharacterized protein n=1 Tax=Candidatus Gallipaludibacter merdavium TaxID=2840839 RepID=A0A9D9N3M4_9BACT|nr:hypothetical protein [Candidatus Gallipaludibacter merdavium]